MTTTTNASAILAQAEGSGEDHPLSAAICLLEEAIDYEHEEFDGDPNTDSHISGADLIDWFAVFRERAKDVVAAARAARINEQD